MYRKFIISVVLVTVTLISVLQSSADSFAGFSDEATAVLDDIAQAYFLLMMNTSSEIDSLFDIADALRSEASQKRTSSTGNLTAQLEDSLLQLAFGLNVSFNSISSAVGKCDAIESGRDAASSILNRAFLALSDMVRLIHTRNRYENPNEIEQFRKASQVTIESLVNILFNSIRYCVTDTNHQIKALIKLIENESRRKFVIVSNLVLSAFETSAQVSAGRITNIEASALINASRIDAIYEIVTEIQHLFSMYETIFIDSYLNRTQIVGQIFIVRVARKEVTYQLFYMVTAIFVRIIDSLNRYSAVPQDNGKDLIFLIEPSEVGAINARLDAGYIFAESVRITQPSSSAKVTVRELTAPRFVPKAVEYFYDAISLAQNQTLACPLNVVAIDTFAKLQNITSTFIVESNFALVRNNASTANRVAGDSAELKDLVLSWIEYGNYCIFKAIKVLAKVHCSQNGTSQDDFDSVFDLRTEAANSFSDVSRYTADVSLFELIVSNGY